MLFNFNNYRPVGTFGKTSTLAALLLSTSTIIYAQQSEPEAQLLPETTITAPADDTQEDFYNAATVTSRQHHDLIQSGKHDIVNVLQGEPGVSSGFVSRSYPMRLSIRGNSSALGMVTVDGIPLNGITNNQISLAPFAAESLESMAIVKGPSAYRYGNTALSGVIRLSTLDSKKTNAFLRLEGGSFGTLSETAGASITGDKGRATVTFNRDDIMTGTNISDPALGNHEKDSSYSTTAIGRYTLYPTDSLELNGTVLHINSRTDLDKFQNDPKLNLLGVADDTPSYGKLDTWLAQQTATLTLTPHWVSSLQVGLSQNAGKTSAALGLPMGGTLYLPYQATDRVLLANWRNQHSYSFGNEDNNKIALHWGGDIREESSVGTFFGDKINQHRTTVAGFTDVDMSLGDWTASAGIRLNHYNDAGTHPTYYMALGWKILPQLSVRGSAGVGYRPPAIIERATPVFGNPALKSESAVSGELGVDWKPSKTLSLSLTGFYSHYHNMIACLPEQPVITAVNAPKVDIQGMEMAWRYTPWSTLNLGTDYTYTDSRNADNDQNLINIPLHSARFFGDWQASKLPATLHLESIYSSGWQFNRSLPNTSMGEADSFRINAQLSYNVLKNTMLYVRGENLNNNRASLSPTFGTPGIAVYGGIKLSIF